MSIQSLVLITVLAPLLGSMIAGLFGKKIGVRGAYSVTILGVAISFVASLLLYHMIVHADHPSVQWNWYTWGESGSFTFYLGFLVDNLSVLMIMVVSFVSLLVHIYSIGYMEGDPGFQRFFAYMSLFTFFMLMLVLANNFLQLFFGWEGVGLVSYLLISFWFKKDSAATGGLKAFIVNRIGDVGFILGMAAILDYFSSLDYQTMFARLPYAAHETITIIPGMHWSLLTVIAILLFIGAMAKSAQIPLHIWLPESMEGPTPISALIHAATMVTAGVYMVARMSPLYEQSLVALAVVMIIGATGALFLGLLAFVECDIKRVIAYSTMSQLGYMMAANGASAFNAGIFHLFTHACFKALLFLAAGSVIIAVHHNQDMRKMGGLARKLPLTCITFLIGALALAAIPPFAGFFSKDAIIEAVQNSVTPGAGYAYVCLLIGSFVTALYIFRAFFLVFFGKNRSEEQHEVHEPRWVVVLPLVILAIPSVVLGYLWGPALLNTISGWLSQSIYIKPAYNVLANIYPHYSSLAMLKECFAHWPLWFSLAGIVVAWLLYGPFQQIPAMLQQRFKLFYVILHDKYGFDRFNELFIVRGTLYLSNFFYKRTDQQFIDGMLVDGSGRSVNRLANIMRRFQSGMLFHYALVMIIGLVAFLIWMIFGR